jgi:hypothetical protein
VPAQPRSLFAQFLEMHSRPQYYSSNVASANSGRVQTHQLEVRRKVPVTSVAMPSLCSSGGGSRLKKNESLRK